MLNEGTEMYKFLTEWMSTITQSNNCTHSVQARY